MYSAKSSAMGTWIQLNYAFLHVQKFKSLGHALYFCKAEHTIGKLLLN